MRRASNYSAYLRFLACNIAACLAIVSVVRGQADTRPADSVKDALPPRHPASPFAGVFTDGKLTLRLQEVGGEFEGTITLNAKSYKASALGSSEVITGKFDDGDGHPFPFTVTAADGVIVLKSGASSYQLKPGAGNAAPGANRGPAANTQAAGAPADVIRFVPWLVKDDPTWTGDEVSRGVMPEGWKLESKVIWDMHNGFPVGVRAHFSDAEDLRACDGYPSHDFFWSYNPGIQRQKPQGSLSGNVLVEPPPADQFGAITQYVVPTYRPDLKDARVIDQVPLKEMSKVVFDSLPAITRDGVVVRCGRVRYEYELHGKTVQEDICAAFVMKANQQLRFASWNISCISSVRGPKGTLDEVKAAETLIQKSIQPGAAFWCKVDQFCTMQNQNRIAEIQDVGRRSRIFAKMANKASDAQAAQYWDRQRVNAKLSESRALYNRSLTQYQSNNGGPPINLPNNYSHAWQGANGQIIQTNNGGYNPNEDPNQPNTHWTPMQVAQPTP